MSKRSLLSLAATLAFPHFPELYSRLGIQESRVNSVRNALAAIKKSPPDFILAEFVYAWGNNYASCHIGNIDSLLASLPKYAPHGCVIVLARPTELEHAHRLGEIYPWHGILPLPAQEVSLESLLQHHP